MQADTATEAVRLLEANFPGRFCNAVRPLNFHVVRGSMKNGVFLGEDTLELRLGNADLHFIPVVEGSKKAGMGKIIIGIALIGLSFAFAPAIVGALGPTLGMGTSIVGGITYGNIAMMGVSMALSGLAQLSTPKVKNYSDRETPDQRASFITNGSVNSSEQGGPVPLIYGRVRTGSVIVASSVTTEQL